jgi:competence transcription factor ComK
MKFATFAGQDGRPVYINPKLVTAIIELNDRLCEVHFANGNAVAIPLQIALVAEDIQKAAS